MRNRSPSSTGGVIPWSGWKNAPASDGCDMTASPVAARACTGVDPGGQPFHNTPPPSGRGGELSPLEHRRHSTGDVGKVERVPAGLAVRPLDRVLATLAPLPKRRGRPGRPAGVVPAEG